MSIKICKVHNEPGLFCDKDEQQNYVYLCRFCVEQRYNIKSIQEVDNEEKQALKQLEIQFDKSIELLNGFAEVLQNFTQQIQSKLKKFKQQLDQSISLIIEKKNQVKNKTNNFTNLQIKQINEQKSIINCSLTQILLQLNTQIKELEISSRLNQLYQSIDSKCKLIQQDLNIDQISVTEKKIVKQDVSIEKTSVTNQQLVQKHDSKLFKMIDKKSDYQLLQQSSYQQNQFCYAIAFNKDATIMIAGCEKLIKVFEFKDDQLKELQQLDGHSERVYCLRFMRKSNQFISGSWDSTMMIWECNENYQWLQNLILKHHTNMIRCMLVNQNDDLLISGSFDKTIKFWKEQNNTWVCDQSIDCQNYVECISLNDQEDQLIASVNDKKILVISHQGQEWTIKQKVLVEQFGLRLCFIKQNQFVFQSKCGQNLQIFEYNDQDQTYQKGQKLQYDVKETNDTFLFLIQYVPQISLLLVKNGNHVHLIKRDQNGQITIEQSIDFNTYNIFGSITDDGKYIATWNEKSKEIQIRMFDF